jgi:hydroxyethylthiazole kinase
MIPTATSGLARKAAMIISPPFLPNARSGAGDDVSGDSASAGIVADSEWIESLMVGGKPGDGGYPLSYSLGWHGGIHLSAKLPGNTQALPVRAIADGTIVYLRVPQPEKTDDKDHPLMYRGEWTDDGCVIIRHETDIGDGADAKVAFFSIYLHLSAIDKRVQEAFGKDKDKRVYRKDKIGIAGKIYGTSDRIHFEIICDDTNLKRLVGRNAGTLDTLKPARTDAIYGDTHFKIMAGADLPIMLYASESPTPDQTATPIAQIIEPLYVRIRLRPEGRGEKAGTRYVHTYREVGLGSGKFQEIGKPISSDDFEYSLYSRAVTQYPKSPSAGYDLLRFGRVIGPDALSPSNAPLWVRINAPREDTANPNAPPKVIQGYVNLHSNKVLCFSDADFPHWIGWTLIQDDNTPDSLCNSPTLRRWLDWDSSNSVSHKEAITQLTDNGLQKRLNKTICRFPTEWEKNNIAKRWSWLMSRHEALENPLTAEAYSRFERHHKASPYTEVVPRPQRGMEHAAAEISR